MRSPAAPTTASRLLGIDAARGAAMLFVCLSHFSIEYFRPFRDRPEAHWLLMVSLIASPTFMLVSGMMAGLLAETRGERFAAVRRDLASRGLFLLTVGHALIMVSFLPSYTLVDALWRGFITDAIGLAIIVGPWLVARTSATARAALALVLYALTLWLVVQWRPVVESPEWIARFALVGPDPGAPRFNFPILPWLALYLAGTTLGGWLGAQQRSGALAAAERRFVLVGLAAFTVAISLKAGFWLARNAGLLGGQADLVYAATSPFQKLPPSPAYFLGFGGLGLILTALLLQADRRRLAPRALEWLSVFGRASLFVFLLQFFVYNVLFYYLSLPYSPLWPLAYAASVLAVHAAARWWLRRDLNFVFDMRTWFGRERREAARASARARAAHTDATIAPASPVR